MVSVSAADPTIALFCDKEAITGAGLLTVNNAADEVPPPGIGLETVTCAMPATARSAAVIEAWSWVALTYVVLTLL